jgi:circadian clock protein KaiC
LNRVGAGTFLTVAQHGMINDMKSPVDVSYLADTVILLRYFEAFGEVRRAISVLKKRTGSHERTIREYEITSTGITVGRCSGTFTVYCEEFRNTSAAAQPLKLRVISEFFGANR